MPCPPAKRLRVLLGMTQVEFAAHLGVSRRAVINWEAGRRPAAPKAALLERLSRKLQSKHP